MKLYRINAIVKKNLMLTFRDFIRFTDLLYWPALDIIVWGFTSRWMQVNQGGATHVSSVVLCSLVLWQVFYRSQLEVSYTLMEELWSQNFANLFSTPLTIREWVYSIYFISLAKSFFAFSFGSLLIYLLYGVNIFQLGIGLIAYLPLVWASGLIIGFASSSIIIYWGQKVQNLVWVIGLLFVPLSGVFYPLSIMPHALQVAAKFVPMSYVFESIRDLITNKAIRFDLLYKATFLNGLYILIIITVFMFSFEKSKIYGLSRLDKYE